ncbi:MAG: hypothetical protein P8X60_02285 [Robiginitalea sp.]|jgi:hypothetical protein
MPSKLGAHFNNVSIIAFLLLFKHMASMNAHIEGTLIMVWNAESGWKHALMDSLHKWISPQTYSCSLCQLTYGLAGPRAAWKEFLESLNRPVIFYHRDEFSASGINGDFPGEYPFVLELQDAKWEVLLGPGDLGQMDGLDALLKSLGEKLLPDGGID